MVSIHGVGPSCAQKFPDTLGSLEGNTEGPGTNSSEPLLQLNFYREQNQGGCAGQGKEKKKMSSHFPIPLGSDYLPSIGTKKLLCTLTLHTNKPE